MVANKKIQIIAKPTLKNYLKYLLKDPVKCKRLYLLRLRDNTIIRLIWLPADITIKLEKRKSKHFLNCYNFCIF